MFNGTLWQSLQRKSIPELQRESIGLNNGNKTKQQRESGKGLSEYQCMPLRLDTLRRNILLIYD